MIYINNMQGLSISCSILGLVGHPSPDTYLSRLLQLTWRHPVQAVMELGAKVCTVHQPPDCAHCPIRRQCQAYAQVEEHRVAGGGPANAPSVMAYPGKVEKAKRAEQSVAACVLELQTADAGAEPQLLLVQRPKKGLLAGVLAMAKDSCLHFSSHDNLCTTIHLNA